MFILYSKINQIDLNGFFLISLFLHRNRYIRYIEIESVVDI